MRVGYSTRGLNRFKSIFRMADLSFGNETINGISISAIHAANALNLTICPENVYSDDQKAYRVYANLPISFFGIFSNILVTLKLTSYKQ
jgi:hypothetical protein